MGGEERQGGREKGRLTDNAAHAKRERDEKRYRGYHCGTAA